MNTVNENDDRSFHAYWSLPAGKLLDILNSSVHGLSATEAGVRLDRQGPNTLRVRKPNKLIALFFDRFRNPLLLILVFAASIAIVLQDWVNASIVLIIVILSAILSTIQEFRASNAVEELRRKVSSKTTVRRGNKLKTIPSEEVVPGDIILLSAGNLIPADGVILEARDFFVSQALLTGETYPEEKTTGIAPPEADMAQRNNCVFMGTSVRSGTATIVAVHTARSSIFGQIAKTMSLRPPETDFERGLRHFGGLLLKVMVFIVLSVLTINILLAKPTIETLLFAVALAVGLTPELLPVILTVTLSKGAQIMASRGVIVRHLNAIENLGSMDILCSDKTGTLTKGVIQLDSAFDAEGKSSDEVLKLARLNSLLQTGMRNALDDAVIRAKCNEDLDRYRKLDEIPYDFSRKRLTIVVSQNRRRQSLMITKGAFEQVLDICTQVRFTKTLSKIDTQTKKILHDRFDTWSNKGFRVLGVATRQTMPQPVYGKTDETDMIFEGFLLFFDPPGEGVRETLDALKHLGVSLKIITGDNRMVARHIAETVGMKNVRIVTGSELDNMKDEALWHRAPRISLFAEVDPNQKERIIRALQKTGHVVGYLGDGINDAPALYAADVGISVDNAADVAKEAADFVLLEHQLDVVRQGIDEGRHTFANTLKYIFITTSANFGNMISMAIASLFLPFLPLLADQILLNNFLSDIPAFGIAGDNVDRVWERTPHRWDIHFIRSIMITFGLVSSVFDIITFAVLLYMAGETPVIFRTGWFVESLLTELLIIFIIRTYKPFYRSRPGRFLSWSAISVVLITLVLPFIPFSRVFGFTPLPLNILIAVILITVFYLAASEWVKRIFYRKLSKNKTLRLTGSIA